MPEPRAAGRAVITAEYGEAWSATGDRPQCRAGSSVRIAAYFLHMFGRASDTHLHRKRTKGTTMRIRPARAGWLAALSLALAACGGTEQGTGGAGPAPTPGAPVPNQAPQQPDATPVPGPGPDASGPAAALPPRPARDTCVDIPPPADGRYTVYEAGSAVVEFRDGRLVLGEVVAAEGWTSRVDDQEADEVEIDFRRGGQEVLDLEVEVDDGRVEAKICAEDD